MWLREKVGLLFSCLSLGRGGAGWPGPMGAVCRWNFTKVQRHLREIHLEQGFEPSQGRFVTTHWSQACLEVVARVAEVEPLRLLFGEPEGFSEE